MFDKGKGIKSEEEERGQKGGQFESYFKNL